MEHDIYLEGQDGKILASYGPRKQEDGSSNMIGCSPEEAQVWGVYRHDDQGLADHVGDAADQTSAHAFADLVAEQALVDA